MNKMKYYQLIACCTESAKYLRQLGEEHCDIAVLWSENIERNISMLVWFKQTQLDPESQAYDEHIKAIDEAIAEQHEVADALCALSRD